MYRYPLRTAKQLSLMYGDGAGRMTVLDPKSEYNIENPELAAYFSEIYEKYNQLTDEVMVPEEDSLPPVYAFTKSNIEAAEAIITQYYGALKNKNAEALVALMHRAIWLQHGEIRKRGADALGYGGFGTAGTSPLLTALFSRILTTTWTRATATR